jgi:hypothetical protein
LIIGVISIGSASLDSGVALALRIVVEAEFPHICEERELVEQRGHNQEKEGECDIHSGVLEVLWKHGVRVIDNLMHLIELG